MQTIVKSQAQVIEMWARTHARSVRRGSDRIEDIDRVSIDELVRRLRGDQSDNINRLAHEDYELRQISREIVTGLSLVPSLGTLGAFFDIDRVTHPLFHAQHYEGETGAFEGGIVGFEGRSLPYKPPARTWLLIDGTFRTLVRLKNGEPAIPLWVPISFPWK